MYARDGEVRFVSKQEKLLELQKYNFAAYDMLLYLDTHPEDKKAFEMFKQLVEKFNKLPLMIKQELLKYWNNELKQKE